MIKEHKGTLISDREISWLSFNERVLQEANDPRVPLLERIKFLAIFSSNLDEFFRVRVAALRRVLKLKRKTFGKYHHHPEKVLKEIQHIAVAQQEKFNHIYENKIKQELAKENIYIINEEQLSKAQKVDMQHIFRQNVLPFLFPVIIDSVRPFPHLRDKSIYLGVKMSKFDDTIEPKYAIIEIPSPIVDRFIVLPPSENDNRTYIILLDDVIRSSLDQIFSIFKYDIFDAYTFKLTRDAEIDIDYGVSASLMQKLEKSLKQRSQGIPVRFSYDETMPQDLLEILGNRLQLTGESFIPGGRYHNFKDFMSFPQIGKRSFSYENLPPVPIPELDKSHVLFDAISKKDFILHHPYQSFDYIIRFLREAAIDPQVNTIKITLYRVAKNSNVINALINAVKNGKKVLALMELRARFDEESNIFWTSKLQEAGVKVIFGKPDQKVHTKICLIYRQEGKKMVHYAHLATGNYNGNTAKLYCDDGILTKDTRITRELVSVFNFIEGNRKSPIKLKHLLIAPINMRSKFMELLDREIQNAQLGLKAYAILKMNSLVDHELILKLYEASRAGVKVKMIIRGICCLVPGVKGLSDNIEVISIIDRFLEHSRIYIFGNNNDERIYMASADWMTRNLSHRIECGFPIYDPKIKKEIKDIINIQLADNTKARVINKKQKNAYKTDNKTTTYRAQYDIYNYLKVKYS